MDQRTRKEHGKRAFANEPDCKISRDNNEPRVSVSKNTRILVLHEQVQIEQTNRIKFCIEISYKLLRFRKQAFSTQKDDLFVINSYSSS
jgi:hypothetical protein